MTIKKEKIMNEKKKQFAIKEYSGEFKPKYRIWERLVNDAEDFEEDAETLANLKEDTKKYLINETSPKEIARFDSEQEAEKAFEAYKTSSGGIYSGACGCFASATVYVLEEIELDESGDEVCWNGIEISEIEF